MGEETTAEQSTESVEETVDQAAAEAKKLESRFPNAKPQLVYELGRRKIELQMQQVQSLDNKSAGVFQAGAALLALVGALFAIWDINIPDEAEGAILVGAACFILILVMHVVGHVTAEWGTGPDIGQAWEFSKRYEETTMNWWAAESFRDQARANSQKLQFKIVTTSLLPFVLLAEGVDLLIGLALTLSSA